jgi:hypothetical protein
MRLEATGTSTLLALLCMGLSPCAEANEVGFYVGGDFSRARKQGERAFYDSFVEDVHSFFGYTPSTARSSFDEESSAFDILVGYRFNRWLALEGAYSRLGQIAFESRTTGNYPNDAGILDFIAESETSGFKVSFLGVWRLTRDWELFARAGALFAENRLRVVLITRGEMFVQPGGERTSDSFSKGTVEPLLGVGLGRRFLEIYDFRLEYQRVLDSGLEDTGGAGDIDALMLGVTATF